jgi:thiamine kinase-like enzyme
MASEIHSHLTRIPRFAHVEPGDYRYQRLGGLTNLVYRVTLSDGDYLLRIAGKGTEAYIDRAAEAHDAEVAAAAGVAPEVLFFDQVDGLMLCEYVDGLTTTVEHFRDVGRAARAARALRRLHRCGHAFRNRFEAFDKIDEYLALVRKLNAPVPDGYPEVEREADAVRRVVQARSVALAPCHCDPLPENFIDTGERMFIVDWEYAGNNDPMWDLGDFSVEVEFGPEQDAALLQVYFGGTPSAAQVGRMVVYKAMCDLFWTLWALIQHAHGNPVDDFWSYGLNRFKRCQALMSTPEFAAHVRAIEK